MKVFLNIYFIEVKNVFKEFNNNPTDLVVGDCTVRAISLLMDKTWNEVYTGLCSTGFELKDMPTSNRVWGRYLNHNGYRRYIIPDTCPDCFTVRDFCRDNPYGKFLLATGTHVVTVINGYYFDTWDCGDEIPTHFWKRR